MNKCVALFVEGETEVEFYKKVVEIARGASPEKRFDTCIELKNVKGVGNFKKDVLRQFKKGIQPNYSDDCEFTIVLCSDTDVFEFAQNPPVDWNELSKDLRDAGACPIIHIEARHSIEDWFLYDSEGIINFLHLPKRTKVPSDGNGYYKLRKIYSMANNMYFKGMKSNGMIGKLNIAKILSNVKKEIKPLFDALGVDINSI